MVVFAYVVNKQNTLFSNTAPQGETLKKLSLWQLGKKQTNLTAVKKKEEKQKIVEEERKGSKNKGMVGR